MTQPEAVGTNRALWDDVSEQFAADEGRGRWADPEIRWGLTATPDERVGALPEVTGRTVVELGCGVAHLSAQLARRGARVVALDLSGAQLTAARRAQVEHGPAFPLVQADAERLPLADGCADLVVSEHAAAAWCDPEAWVGEAARVLQPGGWLVFLTNSPLSAMCVPAEGGPAGDRLLRGPADLRAIRWPGGGVEHHPTHGDWLGVLVRSGLAVSALHELPPPAGPGAGSGAGGDAGPGAGTDRDGGGLTPAAALYGIAEPWWAARWPVEDLWVARRAPEPHV
jgi:SAM-dependent methyltransferase